MKQAIRKITVLLLAFSIMLAATPISAQAALPNRDAYYLSVLKPDKMPRVKASYPVKLKLNLSSPYMSANVEFPGSVGVNTEVTDEKLLEMLKSALPSVNGYSELQDPVDDKVLVEELSKKLKFSDEDMQNILNNWAALLGLDAVKSIVDGKAPEMSGSDLVGAIMDAAGDEISIPGTPEMPGGAGTVVNGIFISFAEYQKDLEKYQDIVKLSQTKARLRAYYSAVGDAIRDYIAENGNWRLVINSQDVADLTFMDMPGNKQLWTADINLTKSMDGATSIEGTYSGTFKLKMEADMYAFDNGYAAYWAKRTSNAQMNYNVTANDGKRSEMKLEFEIPDCQLGISLPPGTLRNFFEEELPSSELMQSHFSVSVDRAFTMRADLPQGSYTTSEQRITQENGEFMRSGTITTYTSSPGLPPSVIHEDNPDSMEWPPDLRGSVTMTLIIDMLGK